MRLRRTQTLDQPTWWPHSNLSPQPHPIHIPQPATTSPQFPLPYLKWIPHCLLTNIDHSANRTPGDESVPNSAYVMHRPCRNTIKSWKLNCSENFPNSEMELWSGSNPAKNHQILLWSQSQYRASHPVKFPWWVAYPSVVSVAVPTQTEKRSPGTISCCDEPVETIDRFTLTLGWNIACIVATRAYPQPRDDIHYNDSV